MKPVLVWSGLSSSTYKIVCGVGDVWCLEIEGTQSPLAPLNTLTLPAEGIPDLHQAFAVDVGGECVYFRDYSISKFCLQTRQLTRLAPHEGPIYGIAGEVCVTPQGWVLAVNEVPGDFSVIDENGRMRVTRAYKNRHPNFLFERPQSDPPFWEIGAWSISAIDDSFIVGGFPLRRIDRYSLNGRLLQSIKSFVFENVPYTFETFGLEKVQFDRWGRIWANNGSDICVFSSAGEIIGLVEDGFAFAGSEPDLAEWFGIDRQGRLWTRNYAGTYGAFEIAGLQP